MAASVRRALVGHCRAQAAAMPPFRALLTSRQAAPDAPRGTLALALIAALHLAALVLMLWSEVGFVPKLICWLTWSALNFFWLALLRRPVVSAALSLAMIVVLILASRLKYDIIWMTANFLDLMIINADTISFLLAVKPDLLREAVLAAVLIIPALVLLWRVDSFRMRPRLATTGFLACFAALLGTALTFEQEDWETFAGNSYVSKVS